MPGPRLPQVLQAKVRRGGRQRQRALRVESERRRIDIEHRDVRPAL